MSNRMNFMIDIETTSADKGTAEILEIGILACRVNKQGIFVPSDMPKEIRPPVYHTYLHHPGKPETNFAKEHQEELFKTCNDTPPKEHEAIREEILEFFKAHYVKPPVYVMGLNASSFDMPILSRHGILKEALWVDQEDGKQELVGDYHYRIEDITGARMLAMRVTGLPYNVVTNAAMELCPEVQLPEGKAHDAVYDCYRQVKMYSGLIRLMRGGKMA